MVVVHGADMTSKYAVMKHIVDVWVGQSLPVLVVSPKLETVSSHPQVPFYQFRTLTARNEDEVLVERCEEFLCSSELLKLLVINTSHGAVNTGGFLSRLTEEYFSFNVVLLAVALPPDCLDSATGFLSSWNRSKNDEVWNHLVETHGMEGGLSLDKIKRGHI